MPSSDNILPPTDAPSTNTRRSVLALILMLMVVVTVPALFGRVRMPEPFDLSAAESFSEKSAMTVFLGNSLLDNRIDADYLSELTGEPNVSLAIEGTGPGIWFLQLENIVAAASIQPEKIFIFFHDDLITRPINFTGVEDQLLLESLTHSNISGYGQPPEPHETIGDTIKDAFVSIYPVADYGSRRIRNPVSSLGSRISGLNEDELTSATDTYLDLAVRRELAAVIQEPKFHGSFDSKIENSFLPLFIRTTKEMDIDLTIVRVAARPDFDGNPNEPPTLKQYTLDLEKYLTANDVDYIDMIGHIDEGAIDAAMYYDGYHLHPRFRESYTDFFAEWYLANSGNAPKTGPTK